MSCRFACRRRPKPWRGESPKSSDTRRPRCVIEPEAVIALIVHTREGAVQTAVNHAIDSEECLIGWLSAVFSRADWRPEALVVVGSGNDLEALMPRLEDVLSVPVFAPAEAELALARGAALASAHNTEFLVRS
jgi:hypothetical protein